MEKEEKNRAGRKKKGENYTPYVCACLPRAFRVRKSDDEAHCDAERRRARAHLMKGENDDASEVQLSNVKKILRQIK